MKYILNVLLIFLLIFILSSLCKNTIEYFSVGGAEDDCSNCSPKFKKQKRTFSDCGDTCEIETVTDEDGKPPPVIKCDITANPPEMCPGAKPCPPDGICPSNTPPKPHSKPCVPFDIYTANNSTIKSICNCGTTPKPPIKKTCESYKNCKSCLDPNSAINNNLYCKWCNNQCMDISDNSCNKDSVNKLIECNTHKCNSETELCNKINNIPTAIERTDIINSRVLMINNRSTDDIVLIYTINQAVYNGTDDVKTFYDNITYNSAVILNKKEPKQKLSPSNPALEIICGVVQANTNLNILIPIFDESSFSGGPCPIDINCFPGLKFAIFKNDLDYLKALYEPPYSNIPARSANGTVFEFTFAEKKDKTDSNLLDYYDISIIPPGSCGAHINEHADNWSLNAGRKCSKPYYNLSNGYTAKSADWPSGTNPDPGAGDKAIVCGLPNTFNKNSGSMSNKNASCIEFKTDKKTCSKWSNDTAKETMSQTFKCGMEFLNTSMDKLSKTQKGLPDMFGPTYNLNIKPIIISQQTKQKETDTKLTCNTDNTDNCNTLKNNKYSTCGKNSNPLCKSCKPGYFCNISGGCFKDTSNIPGWSKTDPINNKCQLGQIPPERCWDGNKCKNKDGSGTCNPLPEVSQLAPCYVGQSSSCYESKAFIPSSDIINTEREKWNVGELWDENNKKSNLHAYTYAYSDELEESGDPANSCFTDSTKTITGPVYKIEDICKSIVNDSVRTNKYYIENHITSVDTTKKNMTGYYINIYDLGYNYDYVSNDYNPISMELSKFPNFINNSA